MDGPTRQAFDSLVAELRGHVDGEVVAAQVFHPDGTWTGRARNGLLRRMFARREDDGLPALEKCNAVALTADRRLHIVACKPKGGRWVMIERLAAWPLGDLHLRAYTKHETWDPGRLDSNLYESADTIKLEVDVVPLGRTLKLEGTVWDGDRLTQETAEALMAATGGRVVYEWDDEEYADEEA